MAGSDYLVVEVVVAVDRGMGGGSFTTFHLFHEAGERKRKKSRTSYPLSPPPILVFRLRFLYPFLFCYNYFSAVFIYFASFILFPLPPFFSEEKSIC